MGSSVRIMIVAGEASGDKHGAKLITALRSLQPNISFDFFGSGGEEMRAAGAETLIDIREVAIMGLLEVTRALPKFLQVFRRLRQAALEKKPALAILIDWPEFNLRLAKKLRRDGQRIIYYISPQIWAWRSYRIHAIKRDVEKMLVILPFEKNYYERNGVKVDYVGHPLLDSVKVTATRDEFCARYHLDPQKPIVALLPGSRHSEIKYILEPLLAAARILNRSHPELQFALPLAKTLARDEVEAKSGPIDNFRLIENDTYNALSAADLAVVASGTATLETAVIGTPLIIVYRASTLNWRLFRPLINVPFVGMPNLIAGREIAPELLQDDLNSERLARQITEMLGEPDRLARLRAELADVRSTLGAANASERAARKILEMLSYGEIATEARRH
ncbi:MAG: lipid-A-disaccharide synthase [Blastocatellia bacterium]|nr:lipid-A-disaccharide synthase [Blastocatellia bacterium]